MSVAQVLEELARTAGQHAITRGRLIGGAIAQASQVPAQIINDRRREDLIAQENARQNEELQLRRNADARAAAAAGRETTGYLENREKEKTLRDIIAAGFEDDPQNFNDKAALEAAKNSKYPELVQTVQDIHAKLAKPVTPIQVIPEGGTGVRQNPDGTVETVVTGKPKPPTAPEIEQNMIAIGKKIDAGTATDDEKATWDNYQKLKAPPSQSTNLRVRGIGDVPVSVIPTRDGKGSRYFYNGQDVTDRVSAIPPVAIQINQGAAEAAKNFKPITTRPDANDPTSNKVDPVTGLSPQSQWQLGANFALKGTQPPAGLGNSVRANAKRQAIENQGAAMAAAANTDMPTLQAEYRAKANELSNLTPTFDRIATAANTGADFLDLANQASAKLPRTQSKFVNKYVQLAQKNFEDTAGLSQFELYVYSASREYARVTTGAGASNAELTKAAADKADQLLNAAQSPKTFEAVAQGMQNDMNRVVQQQQKTLAGVSQTIANFLSATHGLPPITAASASPSNQPPSTTPPPAAPPAANTLQPGRTQRVVQNGISYDVTTDATGKVISAVPVR